MYDSDLRLATLMEEEDSSASSSPSPGPSEDSEEDPEEEEESTASTEFSQTSDMEDIVIERPPRPEGYTKKRVRFPADDMLVSVFEIPQRGDSPLLEELEPCDPERLAEEVAAVTLHPPPPLLSKTTDKPQPSSRSISIVARITGMNNYTPIPKTADKAKSGRFAPNLPKPKPTVTSKQIQPHQRTRKSTTPKPASSTGKNAIDNYKNKRPVRRRRSSDSRLRRRSKSPNLYSSSKRKERDSDTPVTLRTTVCRIDTLKTTPISTGSVVAAPSGATGRQGITLDTRRLTLNERTRASRSLPPRMHPSPYRQSSDSGQRSHTFPDPSPRSESRLDMSNLEGPRTSVRPESRTRRMYAWQAANGMLRPSQLDTPCIAPLWEHTNRAAASEQAMGNIT